MAPAKGQVVLQEEEQICPLCINELDETEKAWLPCSCGYQLCLFCYDRLKTEFSNQCPNCRVEYDSDFQAGLRRRQERVAQLQREAAAEREAAAKAAAAAATAAKQQHVQPPPPPPPRAARSPRSPRRDLQIEQERLWPSLGAAAAQHQQHNSHNHQQQPQTAAQHRQQQQQQHPSAEVGRRRQSSPPQPPPRLAPILPAPPPQSAEAEASSSSSADTAATTPQSPATSVVSFRAAQVPPLLLGCGGASVGASQPPAAPLQQAAAVQGRCAVVLQRNGGGLGVEPDPEGASLAASLQEAVRAGSLSVKQAAASLASYLRQRQLAAAAAAAAAVSSASSSPACCGRQPSSAGSSGSTPVGSSFGVTPFSVPAGTLAAAAAAAGCSGVCGTLSSQNSLLAPCDSVVSVATSASLSHWAPGGSSPSSSLPLPVSQPALSILGGGGVAAWQQQHEQHQLVGSPVRDNHKLPLFMRRGTLRPGAALAGCTGGSSGGGSPSSTGSQASSTGSGSFPGFPSRCGSPTSELKRMIAPPPGFGPPLGSAGIAALPRFR